MLEINNYHTLSEIVYEKIKDSIITHRYECGSRLYLKNLSAEMNASMIPVREALRKLEQEGLVEIIPNKGAIVEEFAIKDLIEIYDLRRQLESLAVEILVNKINQSNLDELKRICELDEKSLEKGNLEDHNKYNREFHKCLVNFSQNSRLIKFYNELSGQMYTLVSITTIFAYTNGEGAKYNTRKHREIIKALEQKDAEQAKKIIQEHIQLSKELALKRVKNVMQNNEINQDIKIDKIALK
jgi:DNA-binding GntR family transcriptional regulator